MISITNICFPLQLKNAETLSFAVLHITPPLSQDSKICTGDFQISCRLPRLKTLKFPHRSIQNSSSDEIKSPLIITPFVSLKWGVLFTHQFHFLTGTRKNCNGITGKCTCNTTHIPLDSASKPLRVLPGGQKLETQGLPSSSSTHFRKCQMLLNAAGTTDQISFEDEVKKDTDRYTHISRAVRINRKVCARQRIRGNALGSPKTCYITSRLSIFENLGSLYFEF